MIRVFCALFLLSACHGTPEGEGGDAGSGDAGVVAPPDVDVRLAARALPAPRCGGSGFFPDVSGVYAGLLETASQVSGALPGSQAEVVTRYAVVRLCQSEGQITGELLVCGLDLSPLVDEAGTCAAEVPGEALIAALPPVTLSGAIELGGESFVLNGFEESWGLAPGASLPAEPAGAAVVMSAGVLDQDEDGAPGVTVEGNGVVPTRAWVARTTRATFRLRVGQGGLAGVSEAETAQVVLGGPASRALRGRQRQGLAAEVLLVRADGQEGSARLDANGDGQLACRELAAWVGNPLPLPRAWACQP